MGGSRKGLNLVCNPFTDFISRFLTTMIASSEGLRLDPDLQEKSTCQNKTSV